MHRMGACLQLDASAMGSVSGWVRRLHRKFGDYRDFERELATFVAGMQQWERDHPDMVHLKQFQLINSRSPFVRCRSRGRRRRRAASRAAA